MCEIDIGNRNSRNWFRYETLFTFLSLKFFRHEERETQYFYADFSICSPPCAAPTANYWSASMSPESQPSFSEARTQLTAFSQISAHASGA